MSCEQEARRLELYGLLGDLPDRRRPVSAAKIAEETRERWTSESRSASTSAA